MTHLGLFTGTAGDMNVIDVRWFDHNNVPITTTVEINIASHDKPRTLEIVVNNTIVATCKTPK